MSFEHQFLPHKVCWLNTPEIIWSHVIGDGMIAAAYYAIPLLLLYATRHYQFRGRLRFVFLVYAAFIFLCGTTHVFDVLMVWRVSRWILFIDGVLRGLTAIVSMVAVVTTLLSVQAALCLVKKALSLKDVVHQRVDFLHGSGSYIPRPPEWENALHDLDHTLGRVQEFIHPKQPTSS